MNQRILSLAVIGAFGAIFLAVAQESSDEASVEVVQASELNWTALNPLRGDDSPRAANLWGDRAESRATGFLVEFVDGFSSPPHIHNVSYRGVVIHGLIHNDDPEAEPLWMPRGSFWTQPEGQVHITAAQGEKNVAYVEIDDGPYLVRPPEEAFVPGEQPINVHASNLVWVTPTGPSPVAGVKVAYLWGTLEDGQLHGTMLKLPAGFVGRIEANAASFRAVLTEGELGYLPMDRSERNTLEPGSYFSSSGAVSHQISCGTDEGAILYLRSDGSFKVTRD